MTSATNTFFLKISKSGYYRNRRSKRYNGTDNKARQLSETSVTTDQYPMRLTKTKKTTCHNEMIREHASRSLSRNPTNSGILCIVVAKWLLPTVRRQMQG